MREKDLYEVIAYMVEFLLNIFIVPVILAPSPLLVCKLNTSHKYKKKSIEERHKTAYKQYHVGLYFLVEACPSGL